MKDEKRLHVRYIPKLITKRKQKLITDYFDRFYDPFIFILWVLVALDAHDCALMRGFVPLLALLSSAKKTVGKYNRFYADLVYILETADVRLDVFTKCHYLLFEFVIQTVASLTAFYWVDEVHSCVALDRTHQSYVFFGILAVTFVLHVVHHQQTKKHTQYFVRSTYGHLNNEVDF